MQIGLLVEVKNPKSKYGRRGISKKQATFLADWRGGYRIVEDWHQVVETVAVLQGWHRKLRA